MNMIGDSQTIAILGATGQVAKSIIYSFRNEPNFNLYLFTRSVEKTRVFTMEIGLRKAHINTYKQFNNYAYSTIINCVGIGNPEQLKSNPGEIFFLTEEIDLLIISYLRNHPKATYINFSSGAVYGTEFNSSVNDNSSTNIPVNNLSLSSFYDIAKINAEAKHRALQYLNIVDLRIFGFYSRFTDLERPYLLSAIIRSLKTNKCFFTSEENIIRDYIHPNDLGELLKRCMESEKINTAFDVCSRKPVTKFEILDYFKSSYTFEYKVMHDLNISSVTGSKTNYFSTSRKATGIGFYPSYTSLECIEFVTNEILQYSGRL